MLEKVVLILTQDYKEKLIQTKGYGLFKREMEAHGVELVTDSLQDFSFTEEKCDEEKRRENGSGGVSISQKPQTTLYLSDDLATLQSLQQKGCYTIAVYHGGVKEILSGTQYAVEGMDGLEWEYFHKIWQRFAGIPWYIADTERCTLREMCVGDLEDLYELYDDPRVTQYTEPLFEDKEKEKRYIRDYIENIYKYYGFGTWLIHRKGDGKLIGRAGFSYRPGFEEPEIGFVIGVDFWRQGYAYEVCSLLMDLGRCVYELQNIQAFVKEENIASIKLLEKLGFAYVEKVMLDGEKYSRYMSKLAL